MKHLLGAVAAVSLGFGLAVGGAYAQGMPGSQMPQGNQMTSQHQMPRHVAKHASSATRMAQTRLKQEGLYRGRIDGIVGPETRSAIAKFQREHGLRETARLDQRTRQQLLGNQPAGFGSSGPNQQTTNPQSGNFTNESGSGSSHMPGQSSNMPPMEPSTGPNASGAGGNNMPPPGGAGGPTH